MRAGSGGDGVLGQLCVCGLVGGAVRMEPGSRERAGGAVLGGGVGVCTVKPEACPTRTLSQGPSAELRSHSLSLKIILAKNVIQWI